MPFGFGKTSSRSEINSTGIDVKPGRIALFDPGATGSSADRVEVVTQLAGPEAQRRTLLDESLRRLG